MRTFRLACMYQRWDLCNQCTIYLLTHTGTCYLCTLCLTTMSCSCQDIGLYLYILCCGARHQDNAVKITCCTVVYMHVHNCWHFQKYVTTHILLFNDNIVLIQIYQNIFTTCIYITMCELLIKLPISISKQSDDTCIL